MKKAIRYSVIAIGLIFFILAWAEFKSFLTALFLLGIVVLWLLLEGAFLFLPIFDPKEKKHREEEQYKKDKESLENITRNNPTLR